MRKRVYLLGLALISLLSLLPLAEAELTSESFSVFTDKDEYVLGNTVNVYVKADAIDPNETITVRDVIVYDPLNSSFVEWHNLSIILTDTTTPSYVGTFTVMELGNYTIWANGTGCPRRLFCWFRFRVWWRQWHVVPESPIGTLMVPIMGLIALAAWRGIRIRRKNY